MIKFIEERKIYGTVIFILILITTCIYLVTKTRNLKTQLQVIQARCSLAEAAIKNPATTKNTKTKTTSYERAVDFTENERQQLCDRFNMKIEMLNEVIRNMEEKGSVTESDESIATKPEIPQEPISAEQLVKQAKNRGVGIMMLGGHSDSEIGAQAEVGITKYFNVNAGISKNHIMAGLLFKF
jgi:hypothetical protein